MADTYNEWCCECNHVIDWIYDGKTKPICEDCAKKKCDCDCMCNFSNEHRHFKTRTCEHCKKEPKFFGRDPFPDKNGKRIVVRNPKFKEPFNPL